MLPSMQVTTSRYSDLTATLVGYERTRIPLIKLTPESISASSESNLTDVMTYAPSGYADDIGAYYFIPKLANLLNIGIDAGINLFYYGVIAISFIVAVWGMMKVAKTIPGKIISILGLLALCRIFIKATDVYIIPGSTTMALIPWCLYFISLKNNVKRLLIFFLLTGLITSTAHFIRTHAGTGVILFAGILLLFSTTISWRNIISSLTVLFIGFFLVSLFFGHLVKQRDRFLSEVDTAYQPLEARHHLWHSVYIGLGFLNNKYGIVYDDSFGSEKARSIDINAIYPTVYYNNILKKEIFRLIRIDPYFIIKSIFAKIGICFLYLCVFANIGLILAFLFPHRLLWLLAFAAGLVFSSLFGILVIPTLYYLTGFIAIATIFGLISIDNALENGLLKNIKRLLKSCFFTIDKKISAS